MNELDQNEEIHWFGINSGYHHLLDLDNSKEPEINSSTNKYISQAKKRHLASGIGPEICKNGNI